MRHNLLGYEREWVVGPRHFEGS